MSGKSSGGGYGPRDSEGWDGKLRVNNEDNELHHDPNAPSPPESEPENERNIEKVEGETIQADEAQTLLLYKSCRVVLIKLFRSAR